MRAVLSPLGPFVSAAYSGVLWSFLNTQVKMKTVWRRGRAKDQASAAALGACLPSQLSSQKCSLGLKFVKGLRTSNPNKLLRQIPTDVIIKN